MRQKNLEGLKVESAGGAGKNFDNFLAYQTGKLKTKAERDNVLFGPSAATPLYDTCLQTISLINCAKWASIMVFHTHVMWRHYKLHAIATKYSSKPAAWRSIEKYATLYVPHCAVIKHRTMRTRTTSRSVIELAVIAGIWAWRRQADTTSSTWSGTRGSDTGAAVPSAYSKACHHGTL